QRRDDEAAVDGRRRRRRGDRDRAAEAGGRGCGRDGARHPLDPHDPHRDRRLMTTFGGTEPEAQPVSEAQPASEPCPRCGTLRVEEDPFCENCGHEFGTEAEASAPSWEVVISADRAYYDRVAPPGVEFPSDAIRRVVA